MKPVEDDVDVEEEQHSQRLTELSGPTQPEVMRDEERTGKHRVALGQWLGSSFFCIFFNFPLFVLFCFV